MTGLAASCATKKEKKHPAEAPATASAKKKTPSPAPTPSPSPTPAPSPTPQARYTATVKVDGVEVAQNQVLTPDNQTPAPEATPAASPTPAAAAPSPTPKPDGGNFLTDMWQKIFPPKPAPAPIPGETGGVKIRVTTADGSSEQVVREGADAAPALEAAPSPTPIQIKSRPADGMLTRMWHVVFPKKQEPPAATTPQWVGTIKLVNERDGYALIDSPTSISAPVGETLNSVGGDTESGVLRVTADRNPPFFIADIVYGKPHAGDRVYSPKP